MERGKQGQRCEGFRRARDSPKHNLRKAFTKSWTLRYLLIWVALDELRLVQAIESRLDYPLFQLPKLIFWCSEHQSSRVYAMYRHDTGNRRKVTVL